MERTEAKQLLERLETIRDTRSEGTTTQGEVIEERNLKVDVTADEITSILESLQREHDLLTHDKNILMLTLMHVRTTIETKDLKHGHISLNLYEMTMIIESLKRRLGPDPKAP